MSEELREDKLQTIVIDFYELKTLFSYQVFFGDYKNCYS